MSGRSVTISEAGASAPCSADSVWRWADSWAHASGGAPTNPLNSRRAEHVRPRRRTRYVRSRRRWTARAARGLLSRSRRRVHSRHPAVPAPPERPVRRRGRRPGAPWIFRSMSRGESAALAIEPAGWGPGAVHGAHLAESRSCRRDAEPGRASRDFTGSTGSRWSGLAALSVIRVTPSCPRRAEFVGDRRPLVVARASVRSRRAGPFTLTHHSRKRSHRTSLP